MATTLALDVLENIQFDFEPFVPAPVHAAYITEKGEWFSPSGRKKKNVVCKYWLRGRCMKDMECEYLHVVRRSSTPRFLPSRHTILWISYCFPPVFVFSLQYDESKMPECNYGLRCNIKGCKFKHTSQEEKPECSNYKLGFCSYGPTCRYRYVHGFFLEQRIT